MGRMPAARKQMLKPPPLERGDTVGVVAPASNVKRELLEAGCKALRRLGYEPVCAKSILEQDLYFAGSVERRARELEEMFERDDVRAIVCARGGYGSNYLLPELDLEKIRRYPKIFVGYSDLTSLLTWFTDALGLVTFHGPMVTKDFAAEQGVDELSWSAATGGGDNWELGSHAMFSFSPLVPGRAQGVLYGGCLSVLVASLGTPYEIRTEGKLLFLEDVNVKPYQIDRMLMQLKLAGKFKKVAGIVFGEMMHCVQGGDQPYTLQEVVHRVIGGLGVPVAYGLRSGHVARENVTLPFGVRAALTVSQETVRLDILEAATARAAAAKPAGKARS
jgi:muramoyltetrapeptide carboxypeptidase